MIRSIVLAAVLAVSSAAVVEASVPVEPVLAQYSNQQDQQERTSSRRSSRGVVKLIGLGVVGAIAVGGWVIKKMRGE